jgi:hypothetical protein
LLGSRLKIFLVNVLWICEVQGEAEHFGGAQRSRMSAVIGSCALIKYLHIQHLFENLLLKCT